MSAKLAAMSGSWRTHDHWIAKCHAQAIYTGVGSTVGIMNATNRFLVGNPRTYAAFLAALQEAIF